MEVAKQWPVSVCQSMDGANVNVLKQGSICWPPPYPLPPLMMMFCQKMKKTVVEFDDVFDFFQRCTVNNSTVSPLMAERFKNPVTLVISCDMALEWKSLGKGGSYGPTKIRHVICVLSWNDFGQPQTKKKEAYTRWCRELHSNKINFQC